MIALAVLTDISVAVNRVSLVQWFVVGVNQSSTELVDRNYYNLVHRNPMVEFGISNLLIPNLTRFGSKLGRYQIFGPDFGSTAALDTATIPNFGTKSNFGTKYLVVVPP